MTDPNLKRAIDAIERNTKAIEEFTEAARDVADCLNDLAVTISADFPDVDTGEIDLASIPVEGSA